MFNIRYVSIRELDISNGENVGVALFVQGCPFNPHCYNCFNPETWDFNGGKEWTPEVEDKFIKLASRPYIKRISILGGEPLADENVDGVLNLINKIRLLMPNKTIWIYSGYTWNEIWDCDTNGEDIYGKTWQGWAINTIKRQEILKQCDIFVDGRYVDKLRDISLHWRGSSNQRVIDLQESLKQNKVVLHCE